MGLVAIVAILLFYAQLEWRDHQVQLEAQYRQLTLQANRLASYQSRGDWLQRAVDSRGALLQAEKRVWKAKSLGLAQAEIQDWLLTRLRKANAGRYTVKLGDVPVAAKPSATEGPASSEPELQKIAVRVELNADAPIMLALLDALAQSEPALVVEMLRVKQQRVEIGISAWAQVSEGPSS
ncbi:GspMb/PilO family protein [Paucibacter sp. APW11]|uniref:GspMb/PilO family protein n=1 Tax=Roseateles aquae TaxID=3077235 RepID=A0ABU3PGI3_9BURK|nr:GspMb/PilO family protein [Paucibacter sp. APW11]MDT9001252.1 GspMb/PilO family protein [Paucibacter sp. APW11]